MYNNINRTLDNIKKSGLFEIEQLGVIEYAIYRPELSIESIKLIINPAIPSQYMSMYVRLMIRGIDVRKYIKKNWELIQIPVIDLENAIIAENREKQDSKTNTPTENITIQDIKDAIVTIEYPSINKPKQKINKRNIK